MDLYLTVKGEKYIGDRNGELILSNYGRVMVREDMIGMIDIEKLREKFIEVLKEKGYKIYNGKKIEYHYTNYSINDGGNLDILSNLKNITDNFMLFLIKYNINEFEDAFETFLEDVECIKENLRSILKPVWFRYSRLKWDKDHLNKVKNNIENNKMIKEIVLYDVPFRLEDSKLILLQKFELDLTEDIYSNEIKKDCYYKTVHLGIKKIDRVEIYLNQFEKIEEIIITTIGDCIKK